VHIYRPGALTPSVVLSLGLGLTVLVTITQIDGNLRRQFLASYPSHLSSPNLGIRSTGWLTDSLPAAILVAEPDAILALRSLADSSDLKIKRLDWFGTNIVNSQRFCFGSFRRRTPGPLPFSSMNTTPADSKALQLAKLFATLSEVSSIVNSARPLVRSCECAA
jgi:hypothetical protein